MKAESEVAMGVAVAQVEPVLTPTAFGQQLATTAPGNAFLTGRARAAQQSHATAVVPV